jgi:2-polyprenyl-3-methyl-5-hydroxy-6-metoxy-1,4-benzoquinol methylase
MKSSSIYKSAEELHKNVPPNLYYQSIRHNPLQRYWHRRRFEEVSKLIDPTPSGKILDIGSADGVFTKVILDKSKADKVIGIDVLKNSVDWANKHWKRNKKLAFKVGDAHDLNFPASSFDAVFILEVLEHVHNPEKVLRDVKRVLKNGGYGLFLVPTDNLLFRIIWFIVTHFWRMRIWDDCHIQSFRGNSLIKIVQKAGFKVEVHKTFLLGMLQIVKVRK